MAERAKASFTVRELTYLLDGGEAVTKIREAVMRDLEEDEVFDQKNEHDLSRFANLLHHWL